MNVNCDGGVSAMALSPFSTEALARREQGSSLLARTAASFPGRRCLAVPTQILLLLVAQFVDWKNKIPLQALKSKDGVAVGVAIGELVSVSPFPCFAGIYREICRIQTEDDD